jgi:hypothetical protein
MNTIPTEEMTEIALINNENAQVIHAIKLIKYNM